MTAIVPIVTVNVAVTQAPNPSTLQQTGAFISQGGTTNPVGSLTLVATAAALQGMLTPAKTLTSLAWNSGTVTATTTAPHGWTNADVIPITIAGAAPVGYNGNFTGTVTGASTVTYPLANNPGAETTPGTINLGSVGEVSQMGTTFFAGLNQVAPYVLELGEGTPVEGIAALTTWLNNNPFTVYSWLVPREWNDVSQFVTLANNYEAPNKLTYFFTTMKTTDATGTPPTTPYTGIKSVFGQVEAPAVPATEFSLASDFATTLAANPNSTNRMAPLGYSPAYGVTPYPTQGTQGTLLTLAEANVNWITTGAAGGLTGNIIAQGYLQDGNQWAFWYSADWAQINISLALTNEVINGSAPGGLPLYYNQQGINRLQGRVIQVMNQAIAAGLAQSSQPPLALQLPTAQFQNNVTAGLYPDQIVVNAEPFIVHVTLNPSFYKIGKYAGLSSVYIPQLGFTNVVFNLNVTNLLTI